MRHLELHRNWENSNSSTEYCQTKITKLIIQEHDYSDEVEIEFSLSRLNRDLNKLNSITTDDLRKLCELVNLDYPFKS